MIIIFFFCCFQVRDDFLQLLLDVQNDIQDQNNNNVPDTIGEKHSKSEIFTVADETSLETDNKNLTEKGILQTKFFVEHSISKLKTSFRKKGRSSYD